MKYDWDRKLVYLFSRDFPNLFNVTSKYINVSQIFKPVKYRNTSYMKVKLLFQPKVEAFKDTFPEIYKIYQTLKGDIQKGKLSL